MRNIIMSEAGTNGSKKGKIDRGRANLDSIDNKINEILNVATRQGESGSNIWLTLQFNESLRKTISSIRTFGGLFNAFIFIVQKMKGQTKTSEDELRFVGTRVS